MDDLQRAFDDGFEAVKDYVDAALARFAARLDLVEARPIPKDGIGIASAVKTADGVLVHTLTDGRVLDTGLRDGKDAPPVSVEDIATACAGQIDDAVVKLGTRIDDAVAAAVKNLPVPQPGKDADMAEVARLISEAVTREVRAAVDAIELPAPPTVEDMRPLIIEEVDSQAARIEHAASAMVDRAVEHLAEKVVAPQLPDIAAMVKAEVAALPAPQPGKDADMAAVERMIEVAVAKAVAMLPTPKDGVGLAGAVITRGGSLTLTLTDGTTRELGRVEGRDADMAALRAEVKEMVDAIPRPQDGRDGIDFDDFGLDLREDGAFLTCTRGERRKSVRLPVPVYRGVFRDGTQYRSGDGVTWGGEVWFAERETNAKPGSADSGWRLAVKKGRDGKDAKAS